MLSMRNVSRVFVSCHRNDRDFVARLVRDLSTRLPKVAVSYYMNISSGSSLAESLLQEIERADVVLAVFSPDFVSSSWAAQELKVALNHNLKDNIRFIPLLVRPCTPNDSLSQFDWINFAENYDVALANLLGGIAGELPQVAQGGKPNRVSRAEELPMTPSQLKRRHALLARSDKALDRWPQRSGPDYTREMRVVVDGLEAIAGKADAAGSDRLERARTWRYAGLAWLDLEASGDIEYLESAKAALDKAEALLNGIDDPLESMKLHANYAQVLRHLARARVDPALIREARRHLVSALDLARTAQPDAVQPLQDALANTDSLIPVAEEAENLDQQINVLKTEMGATRQAFRPPVGAAEAKALFGILKEQVEKETESLDSMTGDGLGDFMARLGGWVEGYGAVQTLEDSLASRAKLGSLMDEFQPRAKRPSLSGPGPSPDSREERVMASLQELKLFVLTVTTSYAAASGTREAALDLFPRIGRLTPRLSEAGSDEEKFRRLEMDEVRGLANEVRSFARQHHVTLACPVWTQRNLSRDVNRVFFSGPAETQNRLEVAASALGLEVNHPAPAGADFAERRWQDLRTANLAVFDLSVGDPQVYYELGSALTLGTELLLIAREGLQPPFDIAQNVRFYSPFDEQRRFFEDELDAALYGLQVRGGSGSSLSATLAYAERLATADDGNALVPVAFQSLSNAGSDPVKFLAALTAFNRFLGARGHDILFPRWPSAYPDPHSPRCFVIMPFRAELDKTYRVVTRAAEQAGVKPVRGDIADGQQIIESIWEEICCATHVVVDLTGLNLNVCLELGIAHTLGRPTWLIGREGAERTLHDALPGIAKWRCHTYPKDPARKPQFIAGLTTFFEKGRVSSSQPQPPDDWPERSEEADESTLPEGEIAKDTAAHLKDSDDNRRDQPDNSRPFGVVPQLPDLAAMTNPDRGKRAQSRSQAVAMILNDPSLSVQEKVDSIKSLVEVFRDQDLIEKAQELADAQNLKNKAGQDE